MKIRFSHSKIMQTKNTATKTSILFFVEIFAFIVIGVEFLFDEITILRFKVSNNQGTNVVDERIKRNKISFF